jgi:KaiC/GvpD/RAD55 family RecA-like ATPase
MALANRDRTNEHVVTFYEHDEALCRAVVEFVSEGLTKGERVVLVTTAHHWSAVHAALRASEAAVEDLVSNRQIVFVDAEDVLQDITVDGVIDPDRFRAKLQSVTADAGPFRIFGEVVSLVAARGGLDMALRLEELGRALTRQGQTAVLCAYHLNHIDTMRETVRRIAEHHDRTTDLTSGVGRYRAGLGAV